MQAVEATHGRVEVVETAIHHLGGYFRADAAGGEGFVDYQQAAGAMDRFEYRFYVERRGGARVDDFERNAFEGQGFGDIECDRYHRGQRHDGEVFTLTADGGLAEGDGVVILGDFAAGVEQGLVFEKEHRIVALQSGLEQPLGVVGIGGQHDPEAGQVGENRVVVARVVGGRRAADTLEAQILTLGPETVLAFVAETVVGATLGSVPAAQGYFRRIREICDQYGILLILDEVMCGSGRCGTFFAFEAEGITPDIVTIAKGLGAGYQPIGAVLCTEALYQLSSDVEGRSTAGWRLQTHVTGIVLLDY